MNKRFEPKIPTKEEKEQQKVDTAKALQGIRRDWGKVMRLVQSKYMHDSKPIHIDKGR